MNSIAKEKNTLGVMQKNLPEDYLIVTDREHLHLLGRFIQAMFLGF